MTLRIKLFLIAIAPFIILGLGFFASVQKVVKSYEDTLAASNLASLERTETRLQSLVNQLATTAINLSRPIEIQNALAGADNEVLFNWGASFIGPADTIIFIDDTGLVIARAPDEFSFGDTLAATPFFTVALHSGSYRGITMLDGMLQVVAARRIDKYDDMSLGVVCIGKTLTPQLLKHLTQDNSMALRYDEPGHLIAADGDGRSSYRQALLDISDSDLATRGSFHVDFLVSSSYRDLLRLKRSIVLIGSIIAGITLTLLLLILHRQFAPYDIITQAILDYASGTVDLAHLRQRLARVNSKPSSEVRQIHTALVKLLDTISQNFQRLEEYADRLQELAIRDALTQLYNRRFMDSTLASEIKRSTRYGYPLSVLLLDIDHFKEVNDRHGHHVGDEVLQQMARLLQHNSRESDVIARWGGEELLIACPGIALQEAAQYAEKLRTMIEEHRFAGPISTTASFGVAQYEQGEGVDTLLIRVDNNLYQAKRAGRNVVVAEGGSKKRNY
ncbi:diguanylate cyclase [bacterium]|nr:diguanylate cyclase [bacterium]